MHVINCQVQDECDNTTRASYATTVATMQPQGDSRVYLVRLILHAQCLVDNLAQGVTDKSLCPLTDITLPSMQQYNFTFPTLAAQPTCDMSEVTPYPGHTDWHSSAYGHLSQNTPPVFPYFLSCPSDNLTVADYIAQTPYR